MTKKRISYR